MFGGLTEKFQNLFSKLSSSKTFTEENLVSAIKEVRLALLEADVNYSVASEFIKRVKQKILGQELIRSVKASEQFMKIVHDELVALMGGKQKELDLSTTPATILLCGLQGSGKTTHCVKLGHFLHKRDKKVLLAACDLQRPAAVEQLTFLAKNHQLSLFFDEKITDPVAMATRAKEKAKEEGYDVVIIDTAGRLHIDDLLMKELIAIKKATNPEEVLFIASAAIGQDAVKTAKSFHEAVGITGSILTMLDGSARAGAAISIREVTQVPLLFEGIGEKVEDLQPFQPVSMADRILGRGDMINLVRRAEEAVSEKESKKMEKKLKKASFTYEDYLQQMKMMQKMGSMRSLMQMIPGFSQMGDLDFSEKSIESIRSIILSMTLKERREEVELIYPRRKRIAKGSGVSIDEVNRMVKGFKRIKKLLKSLPMQGKKGLMNDMSMKQMKQMLGGKNLWR